MPAIVSHFVSVTRNPSSRQCTLWPHTKRTHQQISKFMPIQKHLYSGKITIIKCAHKTSFALRFTTYWTRVSCDCLKKVPTDKQTDIQKVKYKERTIMSHLILRTLCRQNEIEKKQLGDELNGKQRCGAQPKERNEKCALRLHRR